MKSFIGLSVIAMTSGVIAQTLRQSEWDIMVQLNALRAEGFTCPGGQVFEPNPVPLKWDCGLWEASRLHSQDMADQDYFSHYSQDGRTPWQRASAQGVSANAENIAAGSSDPHSQWAGSDGHCRNMMNPYMKSIAIGRGYNGASRYDVYWTQMLSYSEPLAEHTNCYLSPVPIPTPQPTMPTQAPEPTMTSVPTPNPTGAPTIDNGDFQLHPFELELFEYINDMRWNGISCNDGEAKPATHLLEWNCGLWKASQHHVKDMATNNFYNYVGSDGSLPGDLARQYGVDYTGCHSFDTSRSATPAEAWATIKQYMCNYFLMEDKYVAFGAGYAYNANSDRKHYWRIMLGRTAPTDEQKQCLPTRSPNATPRPTKEPTLKPTRFPTMSPIPTMEPTGYPTYDDNYKPLDQELAIFNMLNNVRTNGVSCNNGVAKTAVPALQWNCALWKSSHFHANDMATNDFYSITGSDGLGARDRAERFGDEGVNCSSFLSYHGTAEEAFAYYFQYMCNYFLMETEFVSFGAGYAYNPNSEKKHYWTFTLGRAAPNASGQQCLSPVTTSSPTVAATPIPTAEPTDAPTYAPTAAPTPAPTNAPTDAPTNAPTEQPTNVVTEQPTNAVTEQPTNAVTELPTDAVTGVTTNAPTIALTDPVTADCGDYTEKKACKNDNECIWKKECKSKSKICPKQKNEKKCNKYNCIWSVEGADHCMW